jgi:DNA-binding transcriptional ArsR family regulator
MVNQDAGLDQVFHALADPSRRLIVERLARGPASVSELARPLAMSLPGVMQHLQVLEACSLVASEKTGRVRTCRIEPDVLRQAEQWVTHQRTTWERRLDRLDDYLAQDRQEGAQP